MTAVAERAVRTVTGQPGSPPVLMEDPAAAHQIILVVASRAGAAAKISVSCRCLAPGTGQGAGRGRPRQLIETRSVFPAPEAVAAWRAWHADRGAEL